MVRRRTARRIGLTRTVCENVSGLLVESGLRAHDDDPRVPVLVNPHGRERPRYATGFQARRLTVFRLLIPCRLLRSESQKPLRLVGKDRRFMPWLIVVAARQNCPTDSGQLVGSGDDHDIACGSGFQSAHPLSQTGAFAFDA
jgi:hypothetical protein